MRLVAIAVAAVGLFVACGTMTDDQQIQAPDLDRIAKQRAVVESAVREHYGTSLPGGVEDLAFLQRHGRGVDAGLGQVDVDALAHARVSESLGMSITAMEPTARTCRWRAAAHRER